MVVAARRNAAAAVLEERRVFEDSILLPEISFPGARQSQEVKCLTGKACFCLVHILCRGVGFDTLDANEGFGLLARLPGPPSPTRVIHGEW